MHPRRVGITGVVLQPHLARGRPIRAGEIPEPIGTAKEHSHVAVTYHYPTSNPVQDQPQETFTTHRAEAVQEITVPWQGRHGLIRQIFQDPEWNCYPDMPKLRAFRVEVRGMGAPVVDDKGRLSGFQIAGIRIFYGDGEWL